MPNLPIDDKPCAICKFWNGLACTQTWRVTFFITPNGGIVDFSTVPGMVPEHIKPKLTKYMDDFMTRMLPAIEAIPIWDEIREWQLAHPDRERCPGREVRGDIPYLHVVKTDDLKPSSEKGDSNCLSK